MMFGSTFYNFWAGLIGFTIYFFTNLSDESIPSHILLSSLLVAIISFLVMFVLRYLVAYILYTPEDTLIERISSEEAGQENVNSKADSTENATIEFSDENADNIANVVRTMMNDEQPVTNNS